MLPFINLSGDPEQEYFSDGITDDIITDLSKVSALSVTARNTAFTFKGQTLEAGQIARQLNVTHVLEGSIRKSGDRVRINAQLIDGEAGDHVWADRYDRDLTDIFAIQDEISKAIVSALQLKLLPKEKKAIEHRGTVERRGLQPLFDGAAALDQRQRRGHPARRDRRPDLPAGDRNRSQLCQGMGADRARPRPKCVSAMSSRTTRSPSAERALELDPNLAEALCVKARYLAEEDGKLDEADRQIQVALRLDPEIWEVNKEAARLLSRSGKIREAIPYFEKAASLMESDYHSTGML